MGNLSNIQSLQLDENSLLGRIPKELLSSDSKLSTLNLAGNDLSGTLPEALSDLPFLSEVSVDGTMLDFF
jgi:Leucine-rich repeat (LRR) protein